MRTQIQTRIEIRELSETECLDLLASRDLGRIAIVRDGQPLIFPINYAVSHNIVTFRTGPGTKLDHTPGAAVAFEIDGYDHGTNESWSVLVQGLAVDATNGMDEVSWLARAAIPRPIGPGAKLHRLAIAPHTITGRRIPRVL